MKVLWSGAALSAILSVAAAAQSANTAAKRDNFSWGAPPAAPHILFYGGDVNTADPNLQAFANGNTLLTPDVATFGAVTVPARGHYVITGIFFNQIATGTGGPVFDPATATYDIRININNGIGGTWIAHGSGPQMAKLTGRMPYGYPEYMTSVALVSPLTAPNGEIVWVNESPQCTDNANPACQQGQFYVDNTTQKTGSINGGAQPTGQIYFECNFCAEQPAIFYNWCALGPNAAQCADLSFGIYGQP